MLFDTRIAAHLIDSNDKRLDLETLLSRYGTTTLSASALSHLADDLGSSLEAIGGTRAMREVEMPLVPVLSQMERTGIMIAPHTLSELSTRLHALMAAAEKDIHRLAGEEFNVASPKQLQVILFEKLKLRVVKRTKTGPSTDADVLAELSSEHELPAKILEYRELAKLLSTYIDALPSYIDPATKRVHGTFSQIGAATGRLSSRDPNLQNIPIRTELSREIRKAFVAPEGKILLSADYSQIELRLFAHVSGDANMIAAFRSGQDIHAATAAKILGIPVEKVGGEERRYAKTINFGLMYGMGPFRLSHELGITMDAAKEFIEQYFAAYPGIRVYMDSVLASCKEKGYVETLFGRRRPIPEINSPNRTLAELGKREAVNSVIQGTAADIIKLAMVRVEAALRSAGLHAETVLQIHDELLFELPEEEVGKTATLVKQTMASVMELSVPLIVDTGTGQSWNEAH